jgi:hypothetical protein
MLRALSYLLTDIAFPQNLAEKYFYQGSLVTA